MSLLKVEAYLKAFPKFNFQLKPFLVSRRFLLDSSVQNKCVSILFYQMPLKQYGNTIS